MDDAQPMTPEYADGDRDSSDGAVSDGDTMERPDPPAVDDRSDDEATPRIDVGVLIAHSPGADAKPLQSFAERMAHDGVDELAAATDAAWRVHCRAGPIHRQPSEFLDEAALHTVKHPCDLIIVVTDVPPTARDERSVEGLASPLARVGVASTRRLRGLDRGVVGGLIGTPLCTDSRFSAHYRRPPRVIFPCPSTRGDQRYSRHSIRHEPAPTC